MPGENVRAATEGYEAWNRRDLDAAIERADPEIEWTFSGGALFPGTELVYRGHDGVREFWRTFLEPWPDLKVVIERTHEGPGGVVLLEVRFQAVAQGSGIPFDQRFAHVVTVRDGKLVRFHAFADFDAAFAAAGIPR